MFRIKMPFITKVKIPLTAFNLDQFEKELDWVLCQEKLFGGLSIRIRKTEKQESNSHYASVIYACTIENTVAELNILSAEYIMDVAAGEVFHIGFNIDNAGKQIIEFATNIRALQFQRMSYAMPNFLEAFYSDLYNTDYTILPSSGKSVMDCYATIKQTSSNKTNYDNYHSAITKAVGTGDTIFSSQKELDEWNHEVLLRSNFTNLARAYQQIRGRLTTDAISFFHEPINWHSQNYVAQHIVKQLNCGEIFKDQKNKRFALYIGTHFGQNLAQIQKAYPDLICFGIEPMPNFHHHTSTYLADPKKLFWMFAEDLCDYAGLENFFDYIIIPNVNILSNQSLFWDSILKLMNPNGQVIIGHHYKDAYRHHAPKAMLNYVQERFMKVEFVHMPNANNTAYLKEYMESIENLGLLPQFAPRSTVEMQAQDLSEMAKLILLFFPNEKLDKLTPSLLFYASHFKQFLYRAKKTADPIKPAMASAKAESSHSETASHNADSKTLSDKQAQATEPNQNSSHSLFAKEMMALSEQAYSDRLFLPLSYKRTQFNAVAFKELSQILDKLNDDLAQKMEMRDQADYHPEKHSSLLCEPMASEGAPVGTIEASNTQPDFTEIRIPPKDSTLLFSYQKSFIDTVEVLEEAEDILFKLKNGINI